MSVAATHFSAFGVAGPRERRDLREPRVVDARRGERLGDLPRLRHAEVLERVLQRVLGVGGVERARAPCARAAPSIAC